MKRSYQAWIFALVLAVVSAGVSPLRAAAWGENKEFDVAVGFFQGASWQMAADKFAQFVTDFPGSDRRADALLYEARAMFNLGDRGRARTLLNQEQAKAGRLADSYSFWIGECDFADGQYAQAAQDYATLLKSSPESDYALKAALGQGQALARLRDWSGVAACLQATNGLFQKLAAARPNEPDVIAGLLLLTEANLAQNDYSAAESTLSALGQRKLDPVSDWKRQELICETQLAAGKLDLAAASSTNLVNAASLAANPKFTARSHQLQAEVFERLNWLPEAINACEANLTPDTPADFRRRALLMIVDLKLRRGDIDEAARSLDAFLQAFPAEKNSDLALLTLGELNLKRYYLAAAQYATTEAKSPSDNFTNLAQCDSQLSRLVASFTNTEYTGIGWLNLGWCRLAETNFPASEIAFSNAVGQLPPVSAEQAVARYKLGDLQQQRGDYDAALMNYQVITKDLAAVPRVKESLLEPALYQIVRVALAQTNLPLAKINLARVLDDYPNGQFADRSALLVGETFTRQQQAERAREVLCDFTNRVADPLLKPEVEIAIARTYEAELNWDQAIQLYDQWLAKYTNNPAGARAQFARAWDYASASRDTNAFTLFSNFLAAQQTNELAPLARYWVADFYLQQKDMIHAELNYQMVSKDGPNPPPPLADEALMMAGRLAAARGNYANAIGYFTNLINDPNCQPGLKVRAIFAYGDATGLLDADTNNPGLHFKQATNILGGLLTVTNSPIVPLALGRMGDFCLQLAAVDSTPGPYYDLAASYFQRVMDSKLADIRARSLAEFGLARVLEKQARLLPAGDQPPMLTNVLNHCLNVVYGANLREGEKLDLETVKQAGLFADKLLEELGNWQQSLKLNQQLFALLPPLQPSFQKKIDKDQAHLNGGM